MTKNEIANSINKHSIRPLILTVIIFIAYQKFDVYFFDGTGISPFLSVCYSLAVATYIFKNVLVDLLVVKDIDDKVDNDLLN